jgi:hypothetical protein
VKALTLPEWEAGVASLAVIPSKKRVDLWGHGPPCAPGALSEPWPDVDLWTSTCRLPPHQNFWLPAPSSDMHSRKPNGISRSDMLLDQLGEPFQTQVSALRCDVWLLRKQGRGKWLAVGSSHRAWQARLPSASAPSPPGSEPHHEPHHKRVPHQRRTPPKLENDRACSNIENQPLVRSERGFHGWNQLDEPVPTVQSASRSDKSLLVHIEKRFFLPQKRKIRVKIPCPDTWTLAQPHLLQ